MSLIQDYKSRKDGCRKKAEFNGRVATSLYISAFIASAAATIFAAIGSLPKEVVMVVAAVPGIVALALSTFKPDARSQWWWAKYAMLDDLLQAMEYENKRDSEASKELREFLKIHEAKYPGFGTPS